MLESRSIEALSTKSFKMCWRLGSSVLITDIQDKLSLTRRIHPETNGILLYNHEIATTLQCNESFSASLSIQSNKMLSSGQNREIRRFGRLYTSHL